MSAGPPFLVASHAAWKQALERELGCEVRLLPTRSRKRPLQLRVLRRGRPERGIGELIELRLHPIFDEAPPEMHGAVASWVRSGARARRACRSIDVWIREGLVRVPAPPLDLQRLRTRGNTHDLVALAERVRAAHFAQHFPSAERLPPLTWGRSAGRRTRRSLRLGSCDPEGNLVRIHPVLDQPGVPEFFVRFVLHHELLHAVIPPRLSASGRWVHHGAEFRARERAYPEYELARRWEEAHMGELIRSARRGVPLVLRADRNTVRTEKSAERAEPRSRLPRAGVRAGLGEVKRFVQRLLFA